MIIKRSQKGRRAMGKESTAATSYSQTGDHATWGMAPAQNSFRGRSGAPFNAYARSLAHPSTSSMVRLLRPWMGEHEVIESVKQLGGSVRRELQRPRSTHPGVEKKAMQF